MPPSKWKKTMSCLRSKSNGSLVVQAGFPTSLGDLIVKNHVRLRKSSGKSSTKSSNAPPLRKPESRSAVRISDARPGFHFLVLIVMLLASLLIGKKKFVVGITISAFALLIVEFCLKPCPDSRSKDKSGEFFGESCDFGKFFMKKLDSSRDSKARKVMRKFMRKFLGVRDVGRVAHKVETIEERDEDTYRTHINVDENKLGRIFDFVFFLIVLCGLVRGKAIALLLAIAWCFLFKFIVVVKRKML